MSNGNDSPCSAPAGGQLLSHPPEAGGELLHVALCRAEQGLPAPEVHPGYKKHTKPAAD